MKRYYSFVLYSAVEVSITHFTAIARSILFCRSQIASSER